MDVFRSRQSYYGGGGNGRVGFIGGKAYSASEVYVARPRPSDPPRFKIRKTISTSSSSVKSWWNDPELKRKRRIAKYKYYAVEGKVKNSLKKGFRWFKRKCSNIVRGF